ncbi:hypothetical protein N9W89_04520 [Hellea sp.]|nr:hypothetical protein [Hellea sp.]
MTKTTILKGLLGATALTVFTAGSAHAQLTPAGTNVQNTFTLTYDVGGVEQPPIDTSDPDDPNGPTEFTVDRLIDLTVASNGDNTVAPGATDEELIFSVTNDGNDTQAYDLSIVEEGGDDFDTDDPASAAPVLVYYVDDGDGVYEPGAGDGAAITYDPANPPELGPDEVLWVVITQDIPVGTPDAERADLTLVADTLEPSTSPNAGTPVTADGDGNTLTGAAENVLADGSGTANEVANAGDHSATGAYIVAAANVNASKAVTIFSEDGTGCTSIPGSPTGGYSIPGACVEYVITVENTGSSSATDIVINDVLADELDFAGAVFGGDFTGGSFSSPALPAANTDCASGACVINLTGATLPAPVAPAASTTGTVTIRAFVK